MGINWLPSPASYIFAATRPRRRRRSSRRNDFAELTEMVAARRRRIESARQMAALDQRLAEIRAARQRPEVIDFTVWEVCTANQIRRGDTVRLDLHAEGYDFEPGWGPERRINYDPVPAGPTTPGGISIHYGGWPTVNCETSVLRKLT